MVVIVVVIVVVLGLVVLAIVAYYQFRWKDCNAGGYSIQGMRTAKHNTDRKKDSQKELNLHTSTSSGNTSVRSWPWRGRRGRHENVVVAVTSAECFLFGCHQK